MHNYILLDLNVYSRYSLALFEVGSNTRTQFATFDPRKSSIFDIKNIVDGCSKVFNEETNNIIKFEIYV